MNPEEFEQWFIDRIKEVKGIRDIAKPEVYSYVDGALNEAMKIYLQWGQVKWEPKQKQK